MDNNIIVFILCIISILLILKGGRYLWWLYSVSHWILTDIKITSHSISKIAKPEVYAYIEYFKPIVKYSYYVDGTCYVSDTVALDKKGWICQEVMIIESLMKDFLENNTAYYNPKDHSESILTKTVSDQRKSHYYVLLFSGLFLFILSFILFLI